MELYGFMEREKKIPSYFFIITKERTAHSDGQKDCLEVWQW